MIKHTQTICRLLFDHFVGLVLRGLIHLMPMFISIPIKTSGSHRFVDVFKRNRNGALAYNGSTNTRTCALIALLSKTPKSQNGTKSTNCIDLENFHAESLMIWGIRHVKLYHSVRPNWIPPFPNDTFSCLLISFHFINLHLFHPNQDKTSFPNHIIVFYLSLLMFTHSPKNCHFDWIE